ncbi:hypothetical protein DAPPUDRAFT_237422 [Daphnia pulex]|uniref:Uncharacterized protein n=1 Tax=Daphnia pulex TaxID=6669 RepID=E9G3V5_DAPPU|nr:hypothetical protein DAPPUDRAFT_237422 [Daphnia pulex]|eukprot:EFX85921.1 hypothetical protein DAPPUDRAFT_237422 [Daphnia pulex]
MLGANRGSSDPMESAEEMTITTKTRTTTIEIEEMGGRSAPLVGEQLHEDSKLKLPEIPAKVSDYQTSVVLMIVIDTIKLEEALQMAHIPTLFQTCLCQEP